MFCLAPDTKILMADGTEKAVFTVKVGDVVKAFDAKHTKGDLITAKVKTLMTTENQKTIALNDLKITALHKVVLESGRAVAAKDIKIGDKVLQADGKVITITKIEKDSTPITVYNLGLDGADGYIAGGLRVLEYPTLKGTDHNVLH